MFLFRIFFWIYLIAWCKQQIRLQANITPTNKNTQPALQKLSNPFRSILVSGKYILYGHFIKYDSILMLQGDRDSNPRHLLTCSVESLLTCFHSSTVNMHSTVQQRIFSLQKLVAVATCWNTWNAKMTTGLCAHNTQEFTELLRLEMNSWIIESSHSPVPGEPRWNNRKVYLQHAEWSISAILHPPRMSLLIPMRKLEDHWHWTVP